MIRLDHIVELQMLPLSLEMVEIILLILLYVLGATVDLDVISAHRSSPSRGLQSIQAPGYRRIDTSFSLYEESNLYSSPSPPIEPRIHKPEEEIAFVCEHPMLKPS